MLNNLFSAEVLQETIVIVNGENAADGNGITPAAAGDSWLLSVDLNETDPATAPCKGLEIASWLSDHATRSTRYVIIDDEFVILEAQRKHFLMTDSYNGITEELANRAIAILNG